MFACIHAWDDPVRLLECAQAFSPVIEQTAADAVLLDASGLDRIYGPPHDTAAAIARRARAMGLEAAIALASNPDTTLYAARGFAGISVVPYGDEAKFLESLPVALLEPGEEILETLESWGIRTFRDLALLPAAGVSERLGPDGLRLQKLARGALDRPLVPAEEPLRFEEAMDLDYAVDSLEPLSFILARLLGDICALLEERGLAALEIRLRLGLEGGGEHARTLRLPVPMRDSRAFLKLMQLDLGAHPPTAPILRVRIAAEPAKPRVTQGGLFLPLSPEPEKLELTLARIAALVGEGNAGSPELFDTHRPGAFRLQKFRMSQVSPSPLPPVSPSLVFRRFRPARPARVQIEERQPAFVLADGVRGKVLSFAGPWRTSGDWWRPDPWARDEWDIALDDGVVYRIYCEPNRPALSWFLEGIYD